MTGRPGSVADRIGWGLCLPCATSTTLVKVRYVRTLEGVEVPVDVTAQQGGPLVPVIADNGDRRVVHRSRHPAGGDRPGFFPHWEGCAQPSAWKRERAELAAGVPTPPAAGKPGRASLLGPCAGCYRPDHTAYGPGSTGTLCGRCSELLRAWRGSMVVPGSPTHGSGDQGWSPPKRPPMQYPHWKGGDR